MGAREMIFRPESNAAANTIDIGFYSIKFGNYTGLQLVHSTGGFSTQPCIGSIDIVFRPDLASIWSPEK